MKTTLTAEQKAELIMLFKPFNDARTALLEYIGNLAEEWEDQLGNDAGVPARLKVLQDWFGRLEDLDFNINDLVGS